MQLHLLAIYFLLNMNLQVADLKYKKKIEKINLKDSDFTDAELQKQLDLFWKLSFK
jgi:hypothetical protein